MCFSKKVLLKKSSWILSKLLWFRTKFCWFYLNCTDYEINSSNFFLSLNFLYRMKISTKIIKFRGILRSLRWKKKHVSSMLVIESGFRMFLVCVVATALKKVNWCNWSNNSMQKYSMRMQTNQMDLKRIRRILWVAKTKTTTTTTTTTVIHAFKIKTKFKRGANNQFLEWTWRGIKTAPTSYKK